MFMRKLLFILMAGFALVARGQNTEAVFTLKDRFISSAGFLYAIANSNHHDEKLYGLCYSPSLNMLNKFSDFSVGIASHLSASWHMHSTNDPADYLMISLPAFLQVNAGHLATHNFYSSLGISVGGGYNFTLINSLFTVGPLLITTIRFWFLKHSFTLGYMQSHF